MPIFEQYARGQQLAGQQGMNMLAREQFIQKQQKDRALRGALAQAYIPEQPAMPAMGPLQQGAPALPDYPAQAGGLDIGQLYEGGFGPEAMAYEAKQAGLRGTTPSMVNEYKFWSQLPKADQEKYLQVKRAQKFLDIGEGFVAPSMVDPTVTKPVVTRELKPAETLTYIEEAATKKAEVARTAKLKTMMPKARASLKTAIDKKKFVKNEIKDAIGLVSSLTTGYGAVFSDWPASKTRLLRAKIETIKGNLAFDFLSEMRQNSPTGGAVGQLSDPEREAMAGLLGTLDQTLGGEDLIQALQNVDSNLDQSFVRIQSAFDEDFASILGQPKAPIGAPQGNQDKEALKWANANPGDPRAMQILQRLGR